MYGIDFNHTGITLGKLSDMCRHKAVLNNFLGVWARSNKNTPRTCSCCSRECRPIQGSYRYDPYCRLIVYI